MSKPIIVEYCGKKYEVLDKQLAFLIVNSSAHPDMLKEIKEYPHCGKMNNKECIDFLNNLTLEDVLKKYDIEKDFKFSNYRLQGDGFTRSFHYDITEVNGTRHASIMLFNLFFKKKGENGIRICHSTI